MSDERSFSVDWLTIRQPNFGDWNPVNDGRVLFLDADGEAVADSPRPLSVLGSFESKARVLVRDDFAEISFNPSRWDRPDNVFGLGWSEAVEVAQDVMAGVAGRRFSGAALLTRLDVCRNFAVGSRSNVDEYLAALARMTISRCSTARKGSTVYFRQGRRNRLRKAYCKAREVLAHLPPSDYRSRLADWLDSIGLLRLEVSFGRDVIRRYGWRRVREVKEVDIVTEFEKSIEDMQLEVDPQDLDKLSRSEAGSLLLFLHGYDVRAQVHRNTFYAHRRRIKEVTGYDIGADNITRLPVKPKVIVLRPLTDADAPDWYGQDELLEG
jgi:hypothetical protein